MRDVQTTKLARINCPVILELVADKCLLQIVDEHIFNLFMMCSTFNNLFTVTGDNNIMYSKNRIGNINFRFKPQITSCEKNLFEYSQSVVVDVHKLKTTQTFFFSVEIVDVVQVLTECGRGGCCSPNIHLTPPPPPPHTHTGNLNLGKGISDLVTSKHCPPQRSRPCHGELK